MVHGIFSIHGADREITVPAQVETSADHWTATRPLHGSVREVGDEESKYVVSEGE